MNKVEDFAIVYGYDDKGFLFHFTVLYSFDFKVFITTLVTSERLYAKPAQKYQNWDC